VSQIDRLMCKATLKGSMQLTSHGGISEYRKLDCDEAKHTESARVVEIICCSNMHIGHPTCCGEN
jgi:hypothetical protein